MERYHSLSYDQRVKAILLSSRIGETQARMSFGKKNNNKLHVKAHHLRFRESCCCLRAGGKADAPRQLDELTPNIAEIAQPKCMFNAFWAGKGTARIS